MVSTVTQSAFHPAKQIAVDTDAIPHSPIFLHAIARTNNLEALQHYKNTTEYRNKIERINQTIEEFTKAKDHCLRDKLFALLKTVFAVLFAVSTVFALSTAAGSGSAPLFFATLLGYVLTAGYFTNSARQEKKRHDNLALLQHPDTLQEENWKTLLPLALFPIFGPFAPLYQACTRIPRLEKAVAAQQASLKNVHEVGQKDLAEAIVYFQNHGSELSKLLEKKIQKKEANHAQEKWNLKIETLKEDLLTLNTYLQFYQHLKK